MRVIAAESVQCQLYVRLYVRIVGDLGASTHQHQNACGPSSDGVHRFQRAGVRPVRVLDDEQDRSSERPILDPRDRILRRGGNFTHDLTERLEWAQ